jgi:hypothetical protein
LPPLYTNKVAAFAGDRTTRIARGHKTLSAALEHLTDELEATAAAARGDARYDQA